MESSIRTHDSELREVAALFFKLGVVGVGGPAAHVALMRDEVVKRRGWFTDEEFLDLLGAVNLLPGPNSTELAIHIGRRRAGVAGLIVAGLCFILPAMTLVLACAWAYAAGLVTLLLRRPSWRALALPALVTLPWAVAVAPRAPNLDWLFLYFFKIGSVLYGSGYVLLSFLRNGLVERSGLLTEGQLLDAVAVGQVTPGPVFTTATFIGYLLHGLAGGVVATVGIFLPAFLLVGASGTLVPWIRRTPLARAFLDGVNAGAVSLMGVVCWTLARSALTTPIAWSLALLGLGLVTAGVNSAWLVAGGAIVGLVLR
jgi:chromate transporter